MSARLRSYSSVVTFDTNLFVKRIMGAGLNTDAASILSGLISESLGPAVQETSNSSVSRSDFEKVNKLKSELQLRQSQTYQAGKLASEQLLRELMTNRQRSREMLGSIRSEIRLEINLERGRQKDAALATALRFQDLMTRIELETGNSYATLAKLRHDIFYSLTGFMFTSIAALFGFLRLTV